MQSVGQFVSVSYGVSHILFPHSSVLKFSVMVCFLYPVFDAVSVVKFLFACSFTVPVEFV